jgi:hypothetical protein
VPDQVAQEVPIIPLDDFKPVEDTPVPATPIAETPVPDTPVPETPAE